MSRQYDEYIEGKFELDGEYHGLIEPTTPEQLGDAYRIRDLIQEGIDRHMPDDAEGYQQFMDEQDSYIREYVDSLGDFDNTLLIKNIGVLLRKNGLRLGDLENALGISTGYISRTSKPGSGKKMSIDVVWKIARLFNVSLQDLLEKDLDAPTANRDLVSQFVSKLITQTEDDDIEWTNGSREVHAFTRRMEELNLFTEDQELGTIYHPKHLNPEMTWVVKSDVYGCDTIRPGKTLVFFEYRPLEQDKAFYDFFFVSLHGDLEHEKATFCQYEPVFNSSDSPFGNIAALCERLTSLIEDKNLDTRLTKDVKSWMTNYLS